MQTGILHTHTTVVILFLGFFLFKTVLLLAGRTEQLNAIREKTKLVDIILGVLILATGGYLMSILGFLDVYLWVKIIVVLALIPLGIVAMRKHSIPMALVSLIGFVYIYGVAETKSLTMKRTNYAELASLGAEPALYSAETIYANECSRCHGVEGDAQVYKSANLKVSLLNVQQTAEVIRNGRGKMKAYNNRLNDMQINALAEYVQSLR
jgi:cytochrome c553